MRIEEMVRFFDKRLQYIQTHPERKSRELHTQIMRAYYQRVADSFRGEVPLAWISIILPPELFLSMDLIHFVAENYTIQMLAMGKGQQYFDIGAQYGFPTEACSPHLATIGIAKAGILPAPKVMIGIAAPPCDSMTTMFENLSHIYKCPTFWLDWPYRDEADIGEEAIQHFKRELEEMVEFVEEHSGARLNHKRLQEFLEISKITQDYYLKIHELRKNIPSPLNTREAYATFGIRITSEGKPETIEYYESLYQEAMDKVERGIGAVDGERHRMISCGGYPFWYLKLFDWLEEEYKAVMVVDIHNFIQLERIGDTSDPLECLARKMVKSWVAAKSLMRPYGYTADELAQRALEYKADSFLYFAHFGCKQGCGRFRVVLDTVKEKTGIPAVIVDMDIANPTIVTAPQIQARVKQYFQMLEAR